MQEISKSYLVFPRLSILPDGDDNSAVWALARIEVM